MILCFLVLSDQLKQFRDTEDSHWSHNGSVSADWSSTSQPTKPTTRFWLPVCLATPLPSCGSRKVVCEFVNRKGLAFTW